MPCVIFTKFAEFVPRFVLQFGWICSWRYGVAGDLTSGDRFPPNFQHPLAAKLCVGPGKGFEVQERTRGPLLRCQVW